MMRLPPPHGGDEHRFETSGKGGAPLLSNAAAFVECSLLETIEKGDHSIFVGEVVDAGVNREAAGRPDDQTLVLGDLGDSIFYGG